MSLAVHARPDGDAIGSASALAEYLRCSFGTQVRILVPDPCPGTLAFLVDRAEVLDASADMQAALEWLDGSDLLISLDHGDFSRTDELEPYLREAQCRKVLVDHHQNPSLQDYGLAFSSVEVSSTCELLYGILMQMPGIRRAADLPARSLPHRRSAARPHVPCARRPARSRPAGFGAGTAQYTPVHRMVSTRLPHALTYPSPYPGGRTVTRAKER